MNASARLGGASLAMCFVLGLYVVAAQDVDLPNGTNEGGQSNQHEYDLLRADVRVSDPSIRVDLLIGRAPDKSDDVILVVECPGNVVVGGGTCTIEAARENRLQPKKSAIGTCKMPRVYGAGATLIRVSGWKEIAAELRKRDEDVFRRNWPLVARIEGILKAK